MAFPFVAIAAALAGANSLKNIFSGGNKGNSGSYMIANDPGGEMGGDTESGGGFGGVLGDVGGWVKSNPIQAMYILGSLVNTPLQRKSMEGQNELYRLQADRIRNRNQMAGPAWQALKKMLAMGPYSRQVPSDLGQIFK